MKCPVEAEDPSKDLLRSTFLEDPLGALENSAGWDSKNPFSLKKDWTTSLQLRMSNDKIMWP